jgi:hypothetical protein
MPQRRSGQFGTFGQARRDSSAGGSHLGLATIVPVQSMPSNKDPSPPLQDWQKKQLLHYIEEAGGLDVANLKTICDNNPTIFGPPGKDSIRRSFQKELSNFQRRNPRNYLKLLREYGIEPSEQAIAKAESGLSNCLSLGLRLLRLFAHTSVSSSFSFLLQAAAAIPRPWETAATKKKRWALFLPTSRRGRMGRR